MDTRCTGNGHKMYRQWTQDVPAMDTSFQKTVANDRKIANLLLV